MKLFISWSGEASKLIAKELKEWFPTVLQAVNPFYTPDSIQKGNTWLSEILKHLKDSDFGIICLTPENLEKPWILFEAGALACKFESTRVATIIFGTKKSNLKSPLDIFQATEFNKDDIYKLLLTMNSHLGDNKIDESRLKKVFDKMFSDLEITINKIIEEHITEQQAQSVERSQEEILDEILINTRNIINQQNKAEDYRDSVLQLLNDEKHLSNDFNYSKFINYNNLYDKDKARKIKKINDYLLRRNSGGEEGIQGEPNHG